jgi:hypothetical protein
MLTPALAAMAALQMILFSEYNVSFFRVVEVTFFSGYVSVVGHCAKM